MIFGHGVDIVAIDRMQNILDRDGRHFIQRVFSEVEQKYCLAKKNSATYFAARFAAKEAFGKALKLGLGPSGDFRDIEVDNDQNGAPFFRLRGRAKQLCLERKIVRMHLSISHDGGIAVASVILETNVN